MIRYVYADQLDAFPLLKTTMFRDRADQFQTRLGWDVHVDADGFERDEYDDMNPLYVIWEGMDGSHGGSMRLLPTVGRCMVNEHFLDLLGGEQIMSPTIWECTRFCLTRKTDPGAAAALMLAGGEVMTGFGIKHYVGVFDERMVRIYKRIGASPEVLGSLGERRERICVGMWDYSADAYERVAIGAGVSPSRSKAWFETAFGKYTRYHPVAA